MQKLYTVEGEKLNNDPDIIPWNVYPRPLMERDSFLNLCGWWDFSVEFGGRPLPVKSSRIRVPFPPESLLSGIDTHFPEKSELIYKRKVSIPEGFRSDRLLLHVDAADQHAEVYINDEKTGGHDGGYQHFTLDISQAPDEFTLKIVTRDDLRDLREPYGKQRIKRGGMWYTPFSGLWQSVWIESVKDIYVKELVINTDRSEARISTGDEKHNGKIIVHCPSGDESHDLVAGEAVIAPGEIRNWTPDDPYLYRFELSLDSGDTARSYFALRDISIDSIDGVPEICLNGKPFFFNGLLDQGYFSDGLSTPADPSLYEKDIKILKDLGFNTLRKHVKVDPDLYYAACDRLGMVVFQDMVNNGHYSFLLDTALPNVGFPNRDDRKTRVPPNVRTFFIRRAEETVKQLRSFPCIMYWTIFNEGWGQFDSETVFNRLKELLPDSVIDAASGWHDMGVSDVKSLHRYNEKYIFQPFDKPIILSECGGFAFKVEDHVYNPGKVYGYGTIKEYDKLEERIEKLYEEEIIPCVGKGLSGSIYTQVSDVEDEINGIMTYDRRVVKIRKRIEVRR
ncbi:MAG: hypothetical protein K5668_08810 [Lachnospiraceae bacterium]|nr:hypothetical protein [Lachnospiraceae bacterium]